MSKETLNILSASEQDTAQVAVKICQYIQPGMSLGIVGELGAGKTTLTRYLVSLLGSKNKVSSPTFVLQNQYQTENGLIIEHWDLYRLSSLPVELEEEAEQNVIRIIEWPDRSETILNSLDLLIDIAFIGKTSNERRIIVRHILE